MKRLKATTIVPGKPGTGESHLILGPDDEVPEWALPHLGDHVWAEDDESDDDGDDGSGRGDGEEPPRAGKGSSQKAWAAFAREKGRDDLADASRDEIVSALIAAGLITE